MKKTFFSVLLGLVTFAATAFIEPTLRLIPCEGSHVMVMPGFEFSFTIYFTETNALYVYTDDYSVNEEIILFEEYRNTPHENYVEFCSVINEYDMEVDYHVKAISNSGRISIKNITYTTFPNLHNR